MFLSGTLFAVLLGGCWLYCLTDAVRTPSRDFPGLRKGVWVSFIALTFILGAVAWLVARTARRRSRLRVQATLSERAGRHPVGRGRPAVRPARTAPAGTSATGPDDDPEFLQLLDRLIRDGRDHSE